MTLQDLLLWVGTVVATGMGVLAYVKVLAYVCSKAYFKAKLEYQIDYLRELPKI